MNKFRSDVERKKWERLENTASTSFKRMLDGTAKEVDFRAVSRMLEGQSKLAKAVFDEGVEALEKMADEFMDRLNKERTDKGQKPLSRPEHNKVYKEVYSNVMKREAPDLIGMLQDIIEHRIQEGFDDVSEKTKDAINKGFDRLGTFSVKEKELSSTEDLKDLQHAVSEDAENADDRRWPKRLAEFKAAVEHAVETKFMDVINRVRSAGATNSATPAIGYSPTAKAREAQTATWEVMEADTSGPTTAKSVPVVQLSQQAEAAVIESRSDQAKFHEVVTNHLEDAKKDNEPDSDEEEKKADSWFRRMSTWIKDKIPKPKSGGKLSSLLSGLGKAFLLSLTAPELLKTIADKAREYLTMDNIEKFIKATWDGIYDTGATVVNWILEKLGLDMDSKKKKGLDPTRNTISERVDGKLAQYEKQYGEAQDKLRAAGGDRTKLSDRDRHYLDTLPPYIEQLKKMQAENRAKGDMGLQGNSGAKAAPGTLAGGGNGSATVDKPAPVTDSGGYRYDPATGKFSKIDDTELRPVEGATGGYMLDPKTNTILTPEQVNQRQAATTISSNASRGATVTTVAPSSPVVSGSPVVVDPPGKQPAESKPMASNGPPLQASTALTLSSIPMHAGVDDTLHLMNIGALS